MDKKPFKMGLIDRLKELILALRMNNDSFAMTIGISLPELQNLIESNEMKSIAIYEVLEKIIFSFDDISIEWLILGKGSMFNFLDKTKGFSSNFMEPFKQLHDKEKTLFYLNHEVIKLRTLNEALFRQCHGFVNS